MSDGIHCQSNSAFNIQPIEEIIPHAINGSRIHAQFKSDFFVRLFAANVF
jgi:hypothetical protein